MLFVCALSVDVLHGDFCKSVFFNKDFHAGVLYGSDVQILKRIIYTYVWQGVSPQLELPTFKV